MQNMPRWAHHLDVSGVQCGGVRAAADRRLSDPRRCGRGALKGFVGTPGVEAHVLLLVLRVWRETTARDKGDGMSTGHESPSPGEGAVTAEDVALAERRASEARQRAAYAGLSAARSIEKSARYHEQFAKVQDQSVRQGVSDTSVHRRSAALHRQAAADDRDLAERKRKEFEADLSPDLGL
jgi:hypothetical protein